MEKYVGFKRSQEDFGSLWSVGRYNAYLEENDESKRKEIANELLTYNEEDCIATRHVLEWAAELNKLNN